MSSLDRGHANLFCIIPILVYVLWTLVWCFDGSEPENILSPGSSTDPVCRALDWVLEKSSQKKESPVPKRFFWKPRGWEHTQKDAVVHDHVPLTFFIWCPTRPAKLSQNWVCREHCARAIRQECSDLTVPLWKFSNSVWNVYIIVQKRLFQCTCLHSLLLEILSAISLGGLLACTCHPWLPREEWKACQWIAGKTFPNKCPLMRGCWEQRRGAGGRGAGKVVVLLWAVCSKGNSRHRAFVCKFPTRAKRLSPI